MFYREVSDISGVSDFIMAEVSDVIASVLVIS